MEILRIQIEKILNDFEKYNLGIKFDPSIKQAYLKYLGIGLLNSKEFLKIHDDFNQNKLKKYYFFKDCEIYLLTKIFCKKNKINSKLYNFKFINYFFLFLNLSKIILKIYFIKFYKYEETKNKYFFYFEDLKNYNQVNYSKIIKPRTINIDKKYLFNKSNFTFLDLLKILFKNKSKVRLFELNLKALIYFKALKKLKPKIIFFVEGDSPDQDLISNLTAQINYKTCCFQWGSITGKNIKYGFKNMSHDYFFTWSDYYSKIFKKFNKKTKFIINGNPLIKNIRPKNKILCLIHPNTVFIDKSEDFELNNLISILTKKFKKRVILRYHAASKNKKLDNIITHNQNNTRLIKSLGMSFCAIAVKSSAIIEASSLGIIPLILKKDSKSLGSEFDQLKNIKNNSFIFNNQSDVLKFLKKIINNIKFRKTISKKLKRKFLFLIKYNGSTSIKITNYNIQNIIKSIK